MAPSDEVALDITRLLSIQIGIASLSGYLQCENLPDEDSLVFWQHAQCYKSLDHKTSAEWSTSLQEIYDLCVRETASQSLGVWKALFRAEGLFRAVEMPDCAFCCSAIPASRYIKTKAEFPVPLSASTRQEARIRSLLSRTRYARRLASWMQVERAVKNKATARSLDTCIEEVQQELSEIFAAYKRTVYWQSALQNPEETIRYFEDIPSGCGIPNRQARLAKYAHAPAGTEASTRSRG